MTPDKPSPGQGTRRLLWAIVVVVAALNAALFLVYSRRSAPPPPASPGPAPGPAGQSTR
jgi:hypothetical protein